MKKLLKKHINSHLEKVAGLRVESSKVHGRQDHIDIKNSGKVVKMILDVGANIGQSAIKFSEAFPDATIHCFEPVNHIFEQLQQNVDTTNVHLHCLALGSEIGQNEIYLTQHETTSSLKKPEYVKDTQVVSITTIDEFLSSHSIDRVDLLKIDVEGFDLEVLKGGVNSFMSKNIDFVLVECGFYLDDPKFVLFDEVRDFLMPYDYRLFGIYDQQLSWSGDKHIQYVNACFTLS